MSGRRCESSWFPGEADVTVRVITAEEALARLPEFSAIVDARSESEYADDRLPGAVNWPSLGDAERERVGTLYKQVSPFEAKKLGASLVAANISRHLQQHVLDKPRGWKPLVYCWRGGKRSGSLALVLDQIGFPVHLLEGGYKAFRSLVLAQLPQRAQGLQYRVVCGPTGSGKTRLLQALQSIGQQVLDLEALANHRSSVLGLVPGQQQPTQKHFDTRIWEALQAFDPARPVFVESESKKVGNVAVPQALILAMRASPCIRLELPEDERVALLLEDYPWFAQEPEFFCERLSALTQLRGRELIEQWQQAVRTGGTAEVVRELLLQHYDPMYAASIRRNFAHWESARLAHAADRSAGSMTALAHALAAA
jgi:tRNA 2-selenouridine synthase